MRRPPFQHDKLVPPTPTVTPGKARLVHSPHCVLEPRKAGALYSDRVRMLICLNLIAKKIIGDFSGVSELQCLSRLKFNFLSCAEKKLRAQQSLRYPIKQSESGALIKPHGFNILFEFYSVLPEFELTSLFLKSSAY